MHRSDDNAVLKQAAAKVQQNRILINPVKLLKKRSGMIL